MYVHKRGKTQQESGDICTVRRLIIFTLLQKILRSLIKGGGDRWGM
jgi:hypothetical protein